MALAAAQVIDALAARLAPLAATAGRVYTSRAWPLTTLPAWRVTAEDESVEQLYVVSAENEHLLNIECRAVTRAVDDLDDALHALAAGALPLLFADPVPYSLQLTGISREMSTEGEATVGAITLRLQTKFAALPTAPETIL